MTTTLQATSASAAEILHFYYGYPQAASTSFAQIIGHEPFIDGNAIPPFAEQGPQAGGSVTPPPEHGADAPTSTWTSGVRPNPF